MDEFVAQWLRFDRLSTASEDRRRFPMFNREAAVAITKKRAASSPIWSGTTVDFTRAFTADYIFINADCDDLRAACSAKEFDRVGFPTESERGPPGAKLFWL